MSEQEQGQWGIVELMGHKVVAGKIEKSEVLGKPMLRVDVPETSAYAGFTQFYGESAIYCVTFTSEEVACATAESCKVNPISVYMPEMMLRENHDEIVAELRRQFEARIEQMQRGLPAPEETEEHPRPVSVCDRDCLDCDNTWCDSHLENV